MMEFAVQAFNIFNLTCNWEEMRETSRSILQHPDPRQM